MISQKKIFDQISLRGVPLKKFYVFFEQFYYLTGQYQELDNLDYIKINRCF